MKRTPLRPGKPLKRKQGLERGRGLKPGKPIKRGKGLRKVNPERKAKRAKQTYGPEGVHGDYAAVLRALPCATCGRGRRVSLASWEDVEYLRTVPQSECSHVTHGSAGKVWWEIVPQCAKCHRTGPRAVHGTNSPGWGNCRGLAKLLGAALAWAGVDAGLIPPDKEPPVERPDVPAGMGDDVSAVRWYGDLLRAAWPYRDRAEE